MYITEVAIQILVSMIENNPTILLYTDKLTDR